MVKQYQIKQVEVNERGHKVTKTVSTDDVEVVKELIGVTKPRAENKKDSKATNTKKKPETKASRKDEVIDAEFTEIKPKKKSINSKFKKSVNKNSTTKPKALPAPKNKDTSKIKKDP